MSIREFNREYSMLGVEKCNHMTAEEEMQLHCLMVVSGAIRRFLLNFIVEQYLVLNSLIFLLLAHHK